MQQINPKTPQKDQQPSETVVGATGFAPANTERAARLADALKKASEAGGHVADWRIVETVVPEGFKAFWKGDGSYWAVVTGLDHCGLPVSGPRLECYTGTGIDGKAILPPLELLEHDLGIVPESSEAEHDARADLDELGGLIPDSFLHFMGGMLGSAFAQVAASAGTVRVPRELWGRVETAIKTGARLHCCGSETCPICTYARGCLDLTQQIAKVQP